MKVKLITAQNLVMMEKFINEHLAEGWLMDGSLGRESNDNGKWYQMMVHNGDTDD